MLRINERATNATAAAIGRRIGLVGIVLKIVEDKVEIHELHATMLHCLGLNHERLTYRLQGRDFRLTDVSGEVAKKMLA